MKEEETKTNRWPKLWKQIGKYKFVLIVIVAGAILLLLPKSGAEKPSARAAVLEATGSFDLEALEQGMEETLSKIEGAGDVSVVLTLKGGSRKILAEDTRRSEEEQTSETVVVSKGGSNQDALLLQEIYPQFRGALVVCTGGDDAGVQLKILEAVSALTGLSSDCISICRGTA